MKSIGRDQEKNRAEIILEESGKLSVEEQERVLATLKGMVFTRDCILKNGVVKTKRSESVYDKVLSFDLDWIEVKEPGHA